MCARSPSRTDINTEGSQPLNSACASLHETRLVTDASLPLAVWCRMFFWMVKARERVRVGEGGGGGGGGWVAVEEMGGGCSTFCCAR